MVTILGVVLGVSHFSSIGAALVTEGGPKGPKRDSKSSQNGTVGMSVEDAKQMLFVLFPVREASGEVCFCSTRCADLMPNGMPHWGPICGIYFVTFRFLVPRSFV